MNTSQRLLSMLRERTSMSLYDSGGAYGRHWQRNRKRDIEHEPEFTLKFTPNNKGKLETSLSISVYHWLKQQLHYGHSMRCVERLLTKRIAQQDEDDSYYEALGKSLGYKGSMLHEFYSTYGSEVPWSQSFQTSSGRIGRKWFTLPMLHNGCDIRGGWTDAVPFEGEINMHPTIYARGGPRTAAKGQFRLDGTLVTHQRFYEWASEDGGRTWVPQWEVPKLYGYLYGLHELPVVTDEEAVPSDNCCDVLRIEESLYDDEQDKMFCPMTGHEMTFQLQ